MLQSGLELVDTEGRGCWLETTTSGDSSFYACAGYTSVAVLAPAGVLATVMWREARIRRTPAAQKTEMAPPMACIPLLTIDRSNS